MANEYGASQIKVLEGLEAVRKRPAMYIGSTHKEGLHHLVWEIIDNSVDEHLAGFGKEIQVIINKDGSCTVKDHGRGIPVEINEIYKIPAVELALTKLHAGGKFDKDSYKISGGLHGVGMSCVNALSIKLIVEIQRNGKIHQQEYSRGNPTTKLKVIGECNPEENGTTITFWPDPEIFSTINFKKEADDTVVEVALQYNEGYQENIFGFVNTINTVEGGTHVSGFKTAVTRVINDYVKKKGLLKSDTLTGDDVREGLTSVISIKIGEPQFEGQTKTKLGNSEVKGLVDSAVSLFLTEFLEENPNVAKRITGKALDSAKARLAAKRAKDLVRRKNAFSLGGLPGKLSDCANKKAEDTEVYLVEGDSAGGSARQARNKDLQAILPLKGKILNVEKANSAKALSSEEITNMITAIGVGVGEQFDISKLRYKRIIIMTDADVDGEHIKTLLLTFFFRFMPQLIENGNIFVAMPPLYRVRKKKDYYVYTEKELKKICERLDATNVTRFKGLGEMSASQLWETTMDPKTRKLKRVFIEDAIVADQTFSMLMGDDVQGRKAFIAENAENANLDI